MAADPQHTRDARLLVNGALLAGAEAAPVLNPANGEVLGETPVASLAQLQEAIAAASAAAPAWARNAEARSAALLRAAEIITANVDLLATTLAQEIGLPIKLAQMEAGAAALFFQYRAREASLVETITDDGRQKVFVRRAPIGITGAILPWNAPLLIAAEKLSTALASGNSVVVKPSLFAPLSVLALGALLADVFPAGVLNIAPGGNDLGEALVAAPQVGMISFTGSIAAGRAIMAASAPGLKRLSLELGGNDAAIVLPDADVAQVARRLFMGAFFRGGQVCAAIKRLYVHQDIAESLTAALCQIAEATVLGDPFDPATTMGPISTRPQFDRVSQLVADTLRGGGKALTGGLALNRPGNFYPPTLVVNVDETSPLVAEEQFGPALPILPYARVEDAILAANATQFGLGASVWTSNTDLGVDVAQQLEAGSVWVNQHGLVLPNVPFGGMKQSGLGRANGLVGRDSYCELQTVSIALPK